MFLLNYTNTNTYTHQKRKTCSKFIVHLEYKFILPSHFRTRVFPCISLRLHRKKKEAAFINHTYLTKYIFIFYASKPTPTTQLHPKGKNPNKSEQINFFSLQYFFFFFFFVFFSLPAGEKNYIIKVNINIK